MKQNPTSMVARWFIAMQELDFTVHFVAALTVIEPATDEQILHIQMCHNAIVGHNGVDRTLTQLYSLNQVWKNMKQHVRSYIRNCPCVVAARFEYEESG